jgi:hypothetical protein
MKSQRLHIVLTAINLVLLVFVLAQTRISIDGMGLRVWTNIQGAVLRGRSLEIVDDEGRVRASITLHPGDQAAGATSTAILRLVDENGRPVVKLGTAERGGMLALVARSEDTYVQLSERGLVATKDGQQRVVPRVQGPQLAGPSFSSASMTDQVCLPTIPSIGMLACCCSFFTPAAVRFP